MVSLNKEETTYKVNWIHDGWEFDLPLVLLIFRKKVNDKINS